jgi:hypothetical protein
MEVAHKKSDSQLLDLIVSFHCDMIEKNERF